MPPSPPVELSDEDRIIDSQGPVVGSSRDVSVNRLIYVVPSEYSELVLNDRYAIAKLIGRLAGTGAAENSCHTLIIGPGRWGTAEPFLGIPISFSEISTACAVCEIVTMREGLTPDVSLGTHFFNELVETDILYFALYPDREEDFLNRGLLHGAPNKLTDLLPDAARWAPVVRVLDPLEREKGQDPAAQCQCSRSNEWSVTGASPRVLTTSLLRARIARHSDAAPPSFRARLRRPRMASPVTPEPNSTSRPGSGMKWISKNAPAVTSSLDPSGRFVWIWFGVTSCTTPLGWAVEVVVETGACAQPFIITGVNILAPPVVVIWSVIVAVLIVHGACSIDMRMPP